MSSSVFFRFKSQKEPTRVTFDGTGISVFELKKEIISLSNLGDGTDFELVITSVDNTEEYDDDTSIIPRSTTVIAKRLPAAKPGRGGAARYVSGKMPQNAKNTHRQEASKPAPAVSDAASSLTPMNNAQTEEERIQAMFKMGADQWAQDQQAMANATPIPRSGPARGKALNAPDHPPPLGYICYRCGEKGHWIQTCPTNNDPTFDGRPRVKRTTGIPKSFLKTVEKPSAQANDGTVDDTKQPSGIMVNAEGEWVVAEPDKATWDRFQAKAQVSAAAEKAAAQGSKELQEKGLECSIDKRLFVNPTKTPCCQKTFCHECITNALVENDLRCPECATEDVPIDDLTLDNETADKIQQYLDETAKQQAEKQKAGDANSPSENTVGAPTIKKEGSPEKSSTPDSSRKRPAETELPNDRKPVGPPVPSSAASAAGVAAPTVKNDATPTSSAKTEAAVATGGNVSVSMPGLPFPTGDMTAGAFPPMGFPNMNGFMGMPPNMNMAAMGMNFGMPNPMMMGTNGSFMGNDWNPMWAGGGFGQPGMGMSMGSGMMNTAGFGSPMFPAMGNAPMAPNAPTGMNGMNGMPGTAQPPGFFANQQRTSFGNPGGGDEDSAYFRKPVNPHRHQGRRNMNRPADYREI